MPPSSALWTSAELLAAIGGRLEGDPPASFSGVSIDSRTLAPGEVFFAIRGERHDGHDFVESALAGGAGLAVVSRPSPAMAKRGALLVVDDPLRALERLGRAARDRSLARIVAITGSVGKTSSKEMIKLALAQTGLTHASAASHNNHWGVPLTLARMPRDAAFGVFEIGMNHAGEITPLTGMVRPHIAVVTQIAASHLGHFDSLEGIADAKAEIFSGVVDEGHALINRDTPFFDRLSAAARAADIRNIWSFGRHALADVRLERIALHESCSCVTAVVFGEPLIFKLGIPGEHQALNSLAVLGAVKLLGADLARAALALAAAGPAKGRGVRVRLRVPGGEVTVIDESYNANPASMSAALAVLGRSKPLRQGRRIAVLGDMLELGTEGPRLHAELASAIDAAGVDVVYACGPLMRNLWDCVAPARQGRYAQTSDELREPLLSDLRAGDVVMVKGSLGSRMGPLVEAAKARFAPVAQD
jgi:UDP-N-acetylmuramoyl-tripeptide--D-alanyl-D-alanine ligase